LSDLKAKMHAPGRRGKRDSQFSTISASSSQAGESGPSAGRRGRIMFAACVVAALGFIAFANSFFGDFVLDDVYEIEQNPYMNRLLPPWRAALGGRVAPARPLPYYSFAIDTHLWRRNPIGYHIVNVALHLGSALLLFGIVRRTLLSPKLAERFGANSTTLAFFVATLWVVHPIQTQAVTYIYQRIESMMAFFFIASFYCFVRSQQSPHPKRWLVGSVACALSSIMCKESAVAIPPLVFLYDVVFASDSWRETVRVRYRYYIALLLTYVPLLALLAYQSEAYVEFRDPQSALGFTLSQPIVILRYIELCFYPTEQCLDYVWPMETKPYRIIGPMFLVLTPFVAGVIGIWRRRPWGFLIAAFFLPLLPTSSLIPVNDLANEHRMYISLAAVATAVVLLGFAGYRRLAELSARPRLAVVPFGLAAAVAIVALMCATNLRNRVYFDRVGFWEDVVSKAPHNVRAYENLANACLRTGDPQSITRAVEAGRTIIAMNSANHRGYLALGSALLALGDHEGGIENLTSAVLLNPRGPTAYSHLAAAIRPTDPQRAAELDAMALERDPEHVVSLVNLANAKARAADFDGAEQLLRRALEAAPDDPRVTERLAMVLADKQAAN
jgi:tetratricopeptide (TPR) repeat protein